MLAILSGECQHEVPSFKKKSPGCYERSRAKGATPLELVLPVVSPPTRRPFVSDFDVFGFHVSKRCTPHDGELCKTTQNDGSTDWHS